MPKHDEPRPDSEPDGWDENPEWQRVIGELIRISKGMPDEAWMVAAAQTIAHLIVEVEANRHVTDDQLAVLYGTGAMLVREGRKEITADLQAMVALGKVRSVKR